MCGGCWVGVDLLVECLEECKEIYFSYSFFNLVFSEYLVFPLYDYVTVGQWCVVANWYVIVDVGFHVMWGYVDGGVLHSPAFFNFAFSVSLGSVAS